MKVYETRVCHSAKAVWIIISEWMDTLAILMNAKAYMLYDKGKFISICCIKNFKGAQELGVVITTKPHRGKGYMGHLLRYVLPQYGTLYLICLPHLKKYYEKFKFKKIPRKSAPWQLKRAELYNVFARLFNWDEIIYMKRK